MEIGLVLPLLTENCEKVECEPWKQVLIGSTVRNYAMPDQVDILGGENRDR